MTRITIDQITIDPVLRDLLPARSEQETQDLMDAIRKDGEITDPLIVWGPLHLLIDGHGRLDCWKRLREMGVEIQPPRIEQNAALADLEAVKLWMLLRQLGRRNLDPKKASILRGRLYQHMKKSHGDSKRLSPSAQNEHLAKTAEIVAEQTGVGQATVRRDAAYVDALDAIGLVNSKAKADIEAGTIKLPKKDVIEISKFDREEIGRVLKDLRMGFNWRERRDPGDDSKEEQAEASRPKNGAVLYDSKPFEDAFGKLMREIDRLGNAYHCKEALAANALRAQLAAFHKDFKDWHKGLVKGK